MLPSANAKPFFSPSGCMASVPGGSAPWRQHPRPIAPHTCLPATASQCLPPFPSLPSPSLPHLQRQEAAVIVDGQADVQALGLPAGRDGGPGWGGAGEKQIGRWFV